MNVTMVQMTVQKDKQTNIDHLRTILQEPLHTDLIILPEMWITPYQNDQFARHAVVEGDDTFLLLQAIAQQQHAYVVAGSVPERDKDHLYNTSFVFDRSGKLITKYRKIHLFEITYPDGTTYNEAHVLSRGHDIATFSTEFGSIGIMICFDIRYPLFAKRYQEAGIKLLVVPAAFNSYTGPKHWNIAFQSRAIDNQFFTVGVSPSTDSYGTYQYYGHSIAVNPFGEILTEMGNHEQIATISIDLHDVEKIRKAFPILSNEILL